MPHFTGTINFVQAISNERAHLKELSIDNTIIEFVIRNIG
jgi:hypothetical protein